MTDEELVARIAAHRQRMDNIQREGLNATTQLAVLNERLILERGTAKAKERNQIPQETIDHLVEVIHGKVHSGGTEKTE